MSLLHFLKFSNLRAKSGKLNESSPQKLIQNTVANSKIQNSIEQCKSLPLNIMIAVLYKYEH